MTRKKGDGAGSGDGKDGSEYEVGYGKPPKRTQFKPGQSGNSRGRPKGSKNVESCSGKYQRLNKIILDEMKSSIAVREGGMQREIAADEAIIKGLKAKALKGDFRSTKLILELGQEAIAEESKRHLGLFNAAASYKLEADAAIAKAKAIGHQPPDLIPHPDDIVLDIDTGNVTFIGPRTPEEKRALDAIQEAYREVIAQRKETWEVISKLPRQQIREVVEAIITVDDMGERLDLAKELVVKPLKERRKTIKEIVAHAPSFDEREKAMKRSLRKMKKQGWEFEFPNHRELQ